MMTWPRSMQDDAVLRLALQKEENLREHLTRKVELAELEASERKKEAEAKEAERVDTHNQCKKMLIMVEERVMIPLFFSVWSNC